MTKRLAPLMLAATLGLGASAVTADAKPTKAQRTEVRTCMQEKGFAKGSPKSDEKKAARQTCRQAAGVPTRAERRATRKAKRAEVRACMGAKGFAKGTPKSAEKKAARKACRTAAGLKTGKAKGKHRRGGHHGRRAARG